MKKNLGEVILEETLGSMVDKIIGESIVKAIEITVMIEEETGLEEGQFPEIMAIIDY